MQFLIVSTPQKKNDKSSISCANNVPKQIVDGNFQISIWDFTKWELILSCKMIHVLEWLHRWGFTPSPPNNGSTVFVAYFNRKDAVSLWKDDNRQKPYEMIVNHVVKTGNCVAYFFSTINVCSPNTVILFYYYYLALNIREAEREPF